MGPQTSILPRMEDCSWRTLGRNYLYKNPWCTFRVDEVELPGGARIEYGVLEGGGFAAVVPVTDGGTWCSFVSGGSRWARLRSSCLAAGSTWARNQSGRPGGSSSRRQATGRKRWST